MSNKVDVKVEVIAFRVFSLSWTSKPWGLTSFVSLSFWNKIMHYNNEHVFGHMTGLNQDYR